VVSPNPLNSDTVPHIKSLADGGYHRDVRGRVGPVQSHGHVTAGLVTAVLHHHTSLVCHVTTLSVAKLIQRQRRLQFTVTYVTSFVPEKSINVVLATRITIISHKHTTLHQFL
jgi:hypothetical protein